MLVLQQRHRRPAALKHDSCCAQLSGRGSIDVSVYAMVVVNLYEAYTLYTFLTYLMLVRTTPGSRTRLRGCPRAR